MTLHKAHITDYLNLITGTHYLEKNLFECLFIARFVRIYFVDSLGKDD